MSRNTSLFWNDSLPYLPNSVAYLLKATVKRANARVMFEANEGNLNLQEFVFLSASVPVTPREHFGQSNVFTLNLDVLGVQRLN